MTVDPHNLSGAYALDSLPEAERAAYEKHLEHCPDCAEEVAGFLATSARLGDTAAEPIPAHLRQAVMDAVAHTPQQRPVVTAITTAGRFRSMATRITLAAATLAVIVSLGWSINEHNHNDELQARQSSVSKVLSAPDAQMSTHRLDDGGSVGLVRSKHMDKGVLVFQNLPVLNDSHVYQAWTMRGDKTAPAGIMSGQGPGHSASHLMSDLNGVDAVAITIEPAGGSKQPTTKPIVMLSAT